MNTEIEYQGRKTRRAGSEQRRRAILEAALSIIVRDGIRNVRHRAVAREADVPLSATTYYFKDISDLIADSFTLFAEKSMEEVIEPFRQQVFALLDQMADAPEGADRDALIEQLAGMVTGFIVNEVVEKRDHLVAEQAFMQEAVLDDRLRPLAIAYNKAQEDVLAKACEKMGTANPAIDAELLLALFLRHEYLLLLDPEQINESSLHKKVLVALRMILAR